MEAAVRHRHADGGLLPRLAAVLGERLNRGEFGARHERRRLGGIRPPELDGVAHLGRHRPVVGPDHPDASPGPAANADEAVRFQNPQRFPDGGTRCSEACHDRRLGREAVALPHPSGRDVVLDLLRDQFGDLGDSYVGVHAHAFTLPDADDIQVSTRYVVYLFKRICRRLHPVDGGCSRRRCVTAASGSRSWRTSARSPAEQPAARMTYSDIIAGHRDLPGPAVRTGDGSCTWPELLGRATSAVRWLAEIGAGAREPVAALVTTGLDVIALTLAAAAAGKPLAPMGPRLTERELVPCVRGIDAKVLVAEPEYAALGERVAAASGARLAVLPGFPVAAAIDLPEPADGRHRGHPAHIRDDRPPQGRADDSADAGAAGPGELGAAPARQLELVRDSVAVSPHRRLGKRGGRARRGRDDRARAPLQHRGVAAAGVAWHNARAARAHDGLHAAGAGRAPA